VSAEDAVRFLVRAGEDRDLLAQLQTKARAEIPILASDYGYSFNVDELTLVMKAQIGEVTDAEINRLRGGAETDWSRRVETGGPLDPNTLVQYVLRESYLQTTEDLRSYAQKVKYFNQAKKSIRHGPVRSRE
jgi:hypothetical protein